MSELPPTGLPERGLVDYLEVHQPRLLGVAMEVYDMASADSGVCVSIEPTTNEMQIERGELTFERLFEDPSTLGKLRLDNIRPIDAQLEHHNRLMKDSARNQMLVARSEVALAHAMRASGERSVAENLSSIAPSIVACNQVSYQAREVTHDGMRIIAECIDLKEPIRATDFNHASVYRAVLFDGGMRRRLAVICLDGVATMVYYTYDFEKASDALIETVRLFPKGVTSHKPILNGAGFTDKHDLRSKVDHLIEAAAPVNTGPEQQDRLQRVREYMVSRALGIQYEQGMRLHQGFDVPTLDTLCEIQQLLQAANSRL